MPLNAYLNLVRQHCPELTEAQLAKLREGLQVKRLQPREAFIATGEVPKNLAFIAQGLLKGVYTNTEGESVNVNFFREGNCVADYKAFRQRTPSRYDFIAIEPCELVVISPEHFEKCCCEMPVLERHYRLLLEQALFAYVRRTERFLITDATARYLDFVQADPKLFKRLSVSDLCSYLGIQRQTLTRIRKQLLEK